RLGKSTSDVILKQPHIARGRKANTNLVMMWKALHDINYSQLYEDAMLICHLYWGWILPDLSHIEEVILSDYDKTQKVYKSLDKLRSSSLGTQFRLFKHIQLRTNDCDIEDFKIVGM